MREQVVAVFDQLPNEVQRDFVDDPRFRITLENYVPGKGWKIHLAIPGPVGEESRCVVLRPRLEQASSDFARYVIAHEFAHAFLRNGGWGEITDEEEAADALALHWGFPKPSRWNFWRS